MVGVMVSVMVGMVVNVMASVRFFFRCKVRCGTLISIDMDHCFIAPNSWPSIEAKHWAEALSHSTGLKH